MKFRNTYRVRSSEITPDYEMREYYVGMYFQECFAEYAVAHKCAAPDLAKLGLTWITMGGAVKFFPPMPVWRDPVEVSAWVCEIGGVKIRTNFEAACGGRKIACGSTVNFIADLQTHKPQKASSVAGMLEVCKDSVDIPDHAFEKIEMFDNGCCASEGMNMIVQTVRFDELDFNMHLNNVRYIPRALEAIDKDYRICHMLKSYRIRFEHEAFYGDEIESILTRRGDAFTHLLRRRRDGAVLCAMETLWQERP